jgi:hypothetical protein
VSEPLPPPGVDLERPSVARVYDFYLGGDANWAIDREFGKKMLARFPLLRPIAKSNRVFLHRAVGYLAARGIRQFVDVGSGVPTVGPTHEIAENVAPDSRVVYIDNEPVAVAHSQMLLERHGDRDRHAAINADLRDPDDLWRKVRDTGVIDLAEPVALLLIAVLHVRQPGPDGSDIGDKVVARFRDMLTPGSYLAISQLTTDGVSPRMAEHLADLKRMYDTSSSSNAIFRDSTEIRSLFGDFEMVEPGLTWTPLWHPEETSPLSPTVSFTEPNDSAILCGVAGKR